MPRGEIPGWLAADLNFEKGVIQRRIGWKNSGSFWKPF